MKAMRNQPPDALMADRSNKFTGILGEKMAANFILSRGFRILHTNYRTPFGEIDIIAERDGYIVFLEVKTRISERFGPPLASITETKKKSIIRNCQFFLKKNKLFDSACRIDAIGIELDEEKNLRILRHIKNAIEL